MNLFTVISGWCCVVFPLIEVMSAFGYVLDLLYLKDTGVVHADVSGWLPLMKDAAEVELSPENNFRLDIRAPHINRCSSRCGSLQKNNHFRDAGGLLGIHHLLAN